MNYGRFRNFRLDEIFDIFWNWMVVSLQIWAHFWKKNFFKLYLNENFQKLKTRSIEKIYLFLHKFWDKIFLNQNFPFFESLPKIAQNSTQYMRNLDFIYVLKMKFGSEMNIFGLKITVKSGLEKIFLTFLRAQSLFWTYFIKGRIFALNHKFCNKKVST